MKTGKNIMKKLEELENQPMIEEVKEEITHYSEAI
jgi:hypothetical protein